MNPHDPIETNLERLSETVSLRASEKDLHRQKLMAFMKENRRPVLSPYAWLTSASVRYVATFMLLFVVTGSGVVSAASGAHPGDTLYIVKLKVTEPTRSALILNPEEKTRYALERADLRLKEFAIAAASEKADPETTALITESLSDSISEVSEDVGQLSASGDADQALSANADLQSLLAAHSLVLDTIEEQNPEAADALDDVNASVDAGIASTENAEQDIEAALAPSLDDEQTVADQADETEASLVALRDQIAGEAESVSADDRETIDGSLADITAIIEDAKAARAAGNRKDAFLLYTEADQRLNELKTLIEADRDLGIGVIDSEAP